MKTATLITAAWLAASAAPAAIPTAWESRGVGGGGALFSPSLSPHRPGELYLACDMSQQFHSTDLGRTWSQIDFRAFQSFHESKVQYTSDPDVLYNIDYSSINRTDYQRPVKSADGGQTWQVLPGDPTGGFDTWRLAADPTRTDRVLLVDWCTLWFSGDGGGSFASRYTCQDNNSGLILGGTFWDGQFIYVGTNDGLLVSNDGGQSFAVAPFPGIPASEAIWSMAGAQQGASLRLLAVATDRASTYSGMQGWDHWSYRNVYVLDLPSANPSWRLAVNGIDPTDHPFWAGMSRGDISSMWLGGGGEAGVPTVYRSTDGGLSWTQTFLSANNQNVATGWSGQGGDRQWTYGEVALGFDVSPTDPLTAVYSDYGFVHVTRDGGQSWQQAYVDPTTENPAGAPTPQRREYKGVGIEDTTSWCLSWSSATDLFACFSDMRGIRSPDGGQTWGFNYTGHTDNSMYWIARDPQTGTLYAATSSVHDLYQSTYLQDSRIDGGRGTVKFSTDAGRTWQMLHDFGHPVIWVALDPTNPRRLYASVVHSTEGGIWSSGDIDQGGASTWTRLPQPAGTEGHPFNIVVLNDGTVVTTFSGRRNGAGAFTPSSGVFVSTDAGQTWQDRSDAGMRYWTKDLTVDPHDPTQSTWYVGVWGGWGGAPNALGGLYRSRDRGLSWTRIYTIDRATRVTISPTDRNEAYLTTGTDGLWTTSDLGAATPTWTQATYPFRQPERVFFNPFDPTEVWVTSFGNGLRVGKTGASTGQTLLRNTTVSDLDPVTPPLASFLPLVAPRDVYQSNFTAGSSDPEGTILTDATRPLVFYGLDGPGRVQLSKTPTGSIRIDF